VFEDIPVFSLETPALRSMELVPIKHEDQTFIMVTDPVGVIEAPVLLVPDPILLLFFEMADGQTTVGEMAQKATMSTGQIIPQGHFESVAEQLDEALMLQTVRFRDALVEKYTEYMESPVRHYKSFMAPNGDRLLMMKELDDEFRRHMMSPYSPPQNLDLPAGSVRGVLSPHIDYSRGGEAYAWAYKALKDKGTNAKTYIILGTSHGPLRFPICATRKNYDTPFGQVDTNQEILSELEAKCGETIFADEFAHADEHSIELQATYLKHTFQDKPVKIVPLLINGFEQHLVEGGQPIDNPEIQTFIEAMKEILAKYGDEVAVIGGVDLSHCGPQFGHEQLNEEDREKEIQQHDFATMDLIEKGDANAFFEHFRPKVNEFNVCSIAPIYCMMKIFNGDSKVQKLNYQQANSPDKANLVSFACVAYLKNGTQQESKPKIILASR
jgi:MEMO1 family protein